MKKGTASEEELKKLYDPNTFFEHGDNPAFKQFMNISVENLREGKLTDHRTYVVDTYKKYILIIIINIIQDKLSFVIYINSFILQLSI